MQKKEPINFRAKDFPNLKFFFVKNLHLLGADAICLFWIDEIHIDEKIKDHPILEDILKHEIKHYDFAMKIIETEKEDSIKSIFKCMALMFLNNAWDFYDTIRIEIKKLLKR